MGRKGLVGMWGALAKMYKWGVGRETLGLGHSGNGKGGGGRGLGDPGPGAVNGTKGKR